MGWPTRWSFSSQLKPAQLPCFPQCPAYLLPVQPLRSLPAFPHSAFFSASPRAASPLCSHLLRPPLTPLVLPPHTHTKTMTLCSCFNRPSSAISPRTCSTYACTCCGQSSMPADGQIRWPDGCAIPRITHHIRGGWTHLVVKATTSWWDNYSCDAPGFERARTCVNVVLA